MGHLPGLCVNDALKKPALTNQHGRQEKRSSNFSVAETPLKLLAHSAEKLACIGSFDGAGKPEDTRIVLFECLSIKENGMKILYFAFAIATGAWPLRSHAETLAVRTGSWELTATTTTAGMMIPKEALAGMTPDQRVKIEAAMRASAGKPTTRTSTECLTQQELDHSQLVDSENPECTRKVIAQSAHHLEAEQSCPAPTNSKAHFIFDATSATSYTASIDVAQGEGGKVHVKVTGRWLSATCKKGDH